jgi:hypothetical protein
MQAPPYQIFCYNPTILHSGSYILYIQDKVVYNCQSPWELERKNDSYFLHYG